MVRPPVAEGRMIPPVWELKRNDPLYYRARRQSHRERGLCLNCTRPAVPGKRRCLICARRTRRLQTDPKHIEGHKQFLKRQRQNRYENGCCPRCGKVLGQFDSPQYKLCRDCRQYSAQYTAAYQQRVRAERAAEGLCLRCGKKRPDARYVNCETCRNKAKIRQKRYYRSKLVQPPKARASRAGAGGPGTGDGKE